MKTGTDYFLGGNIKNQPVPFLTHLHPGLGSNIKYE